MDLQTIPQPYVVLPLIAYFFGAISFAVLIAKSKGIDLRKVGSGNVGATNVGRTVGKGWGVLCFLLDMLKGLIPTAVAGMLIRRHTGGDLPDASLQGLWLLVGAGCIFGHVFPVWLKFRGGKGVATALGVVLGVYPYFTLAGAAAFGVWILTVLIWRYVSLSSVLGAVSFLAFFVGFSLCDSGMDALQSLWPLLTFATVMAALIVVRHRSNIKRLLDGTECKVGQKNKPKVDLGVE